MKPICVGLNIVSANYNNAPFLEEYFQSIINSSCLPEKLIVVDDCSTDNSREVIQAYTNKYSWIQSVFLSENVGVAHATNAGYDCVEGELVLRLDPDDYINEKRIEEQYNFMKNHAEVDVYGGQCVYFESTTGKQLNVSKFPIAEKQIENLFRLAENGVLNGTTIFRSKWLKTVKLRNEKVWAEDYDFFARILSNGGRFSASSEVLTFVRVHTGSATTNIQLDTLLKARETCLEEFGKAPSIAETKRNFYHLVHYRKHLIEKQFIKRYYHLFMAVLFRPEKLLKRFRK